MNPFFQRSEAHGFIKSAAFQRNLHETTAIDSVSESIFGFMSNESDLYDFLNAADWPDIPESTTSQNAPDFYGNVVLSPFKYPTMRRLKKIYTPGGSPVTETEPPSALDDETFEGGRYFFTASGAPVEIFPPVGVLDSYDDWTHGHQRDHNVGMSTSFYIVMSNPDSLHPGPVDGFFNASASATLYMGRRSRFKFSYLVTGFLANCDFTWDDPLSDSPTIGNLGLVEEFTLPPFTFKTLPEIWAGGSPPTQNTGYFLILNETPAAFTTRTGLSIS